MRKSRNRGGMILLLLVQIIFIFFNVKSFSQDKVKKVVKDKKENQEKKEVKQQKIEKEFKELAVGDKYFNFNLKSLKDEQINTDDYIGKKIIIFKFGSIYCSSCISSIPKLVKIQSKYEKNVKLIEVNLDIYGIGRARRLYDKLGKILNYPVVVDIGLEISKHYGVTTLPTNVVIDKDGKIRYISRGYSELEEENLEDVINTILEEKELKVPIIGEEALKILLPSNITKTFQKEIYVIGRVTTPGVRVAMTLNGGSRNEIVTNKEMFYFRTPLSIGSNYIELTIPTESEQNNSKAVVIFRSSGFGAGSSEEKVPFPEYKFHTKEREAQCSECHELVPPATDGKNTMLITDFCLKCHAEMLSDKFVHGPISVGGCLPCHEFDSTPNRYKLRGRGAELCYICHADKKKELEKENLHGPMAANICVLCHNPHSAPYKYQLQRWGGELCYFCHSALRRFQAKENQHPPFKKGECTKCHNPHSSDSKQFFLQEKEIVDLCFSCHKKEAFWSHRHKIGIIPTKVKLPKDRRLDAEGRLICTTCHNPHGDDSPKMLPKGGCEACHK